MSITVSVFGSLRNGIGLIELGYRAYSIYGVSGFETSVISILLPASACQIVQCL